jgi:ABC-2 type transport system permease protein
VRPNTAGTSSIDGAISTVLWPSLAVVPLLVVYGGKGSAQRAFAGWSLRRGAGGDGLVHLCCRACSKGPSTPAWPAVVDHVRKGTLDFVLLKPADAQFFVSTARFSPLARVQRRHWAPWRYFSFAFWQLGRAPSRGPAARRGVLLAGFDAAAVLALDPHRQREPSSW